MPEAVAKNNPIADDALTRLSDQLAGPMADVNSLILERMQSPVALIPQLAGWLIASGGKRIRPLLTLAAVALCGKIQDPRAALLAATVEFIHSATLLHDDVVDESALRRGRASANATYGNQAAVLVGDFLFSRAFECMVETRNLEVLRILSHASAVIAEGEVLQLSAEKDLSTDIHTYMRVIHGKTAALFEAAGHAGAVLADAPNDQTQALATYGLELGLAFQLVDDVLDYSADQAKLGKTVGDDFREGKVTLPVILAVEAADVDELAFWQRVIEHGRQDEGDLAKARAILQRHGALAATMNRAVEHSRVAREALKIFPASPLRDLLADLADFTVSRGF